jgi:hypothetical protein
MALTREAILAFDDLPRESVEVWGDSVWVRCMTAKERDEFESSVLVTKGKNTELNRKNIRAQLVIRTTVDEKGKRVFTNDDVDAVGGKSSKEIDKIFEVASRLSGLSQKDVEELAGNS